jgi:hypothetical protein
VTPVYDYRISNGASVVSGAGSFTTLTSSTAVTGAGSNFLSVPLGSLLLGYDSQIVGTVASVTDNLNLTLRANALLAYGGSAWFYDPLVNVETLTPVFPFAPKGIPRSWYQSFDLGDANKRGLGTPLTTWHFGFVTRPFRDALRGYCPVGTASANVWIRTKQLDNADAYLTCSAVLLWPDAEPKDAGRRVPFDIEFRAIVVI